MKRPVGTHASSCYVRTSVGGDGAKALVQITGLELADAHRTLHPGVQAHLWIGRNGNRYRFDHLHAGTALVAQVVSSSYLHQPRQAKLTDRAALTACVNVIARTGAELPTAVTVPALFRTVSASMPPPLIAWSATHAAAIAETRERDGQLSLVRSMHRNSLARIPTESS